MAVQGPNEVAADYTIRMNYTTVPKTWTPVKKRVCCWAPSDYKYYYTSGFLSIQVQQDLVGRTSVIRSSAYQWHDCCRHLPM